MELVMPGGSELWFDLLNGNPDSVSLAFEVANDFRHIKNQGTRTKGSL
jgi:hypothetical protein